MRSEATVLRVTRAFTLAAVMLGGGLTGHVAAGGSVPPGATLAPIFFLVVAALTPFLGAPAGPLRVVVLLLVGQAALHWMFHETSHHAMTAAPARHLGGDMTMSSAPAGDELMLIAHVLAATLVALWLAAGERAFWRLVMLAADLLVDAWSRAARRPTASVAALARRGAVAARGWDDRAVSRCRLVAARAPRRGPPALRRA